MSKVRSALIFSVLTQYSRQIINLVTIVVLARLLTPSEIGVYAVAASVVFLVIELRALGIGQYLIREKQICNKKIRSALGLMIVVSWGLAIILVIGAPFIAEFYREPALSIIFWIIACTFIFAPFSALPDALLTRDMKFKTLLLVKSLSTFVQAASSIGFVLLGYSYYGLAMGVLVGRLTHLLIISYYRPEGMPWLPSFSKFKDLLSFGIFTSAASTLQQFSLSIPDLVLGRVATMADVGLFSRGLGVVVFLNSILGQAVSPVVLPHLSEVNRAGKSVGDAYLKAIMLLTSVCWPVFAVVNLSAYPLIQGMFGDQWDAAVPIASILAIWAILQSTHSFSSHALMVVKKEKVILKKEVIIFIARLAAVLVAVPYGMLMVAWAIVFSGFVEIIVNTWVIKKALNIDVRSMVVRLAPNLVLAAICWGSLKLLGLFIPFETINSFLSLFIIGVSMLLVWLLSLRLMGHETWDIVVKIARRILPTPVTQKNT